MNIIQYIFKTDQFMLTKCCLHKSHNPLEFRYWQCEYQGGYYRCLLKWHICLLSVTCSRTQAIDRCRLPASPEVLVCALHDFRLPFSWQKKLFISPPVDVIQTNTILQNPVIFLQNTHQRHLIARPHGRAMMCLCEFKAWSISYKYIFHIGCNIVL